MPPRETGTGYSTARSRLAAERMHRNSRFHDWRERLAAAGVGPWGRPGNPGARDPIEAPSARSRCTSRRSGSELRGLAPLPGRVHDLLHGPAVAVRVTEEHEAAPREVLHVAHLDPARGEVV